MKRMKGKKRARKVILSAIDIDEPEARLSALDLDEPEARLSALDLDEPASRLATAFEGELHAWAMARVTGADVKPGAIVNLNLAEHGTRLQAMTASLATVCGRLQHHATHGLGVHPALVQETIRVGLSAAETHNQMDRLVSIPPSSREKKA